MLSQNFKPFLMFFDFESKLSNKAHFFSDNLVKFLVLLIGIIWKVFIQIILGNSVHNIFLPTGSSIYMWA
jgi:hypothetical protein